MADERITTDDIKVDLDAFKTEHANVTCPKTYFIYTSKGENMGLSKTSFNNDMQNLGLAYCQKHDVWYWHNHLKLDTRHGRIHLSEKDLFDEKLLYSFLYPQYVDLG